MFRLHRGERSCGHGDRGGEWSCTSEAGEARGAQLALFAVREIGAVAKGARGAGVGRKVRTCRAWGAHEAGHRGQKGFATTEETFLCDDHTYFIQWLVRSLTYHHFHSVASVLLYISSFPFSG